MNPIVKKPKIDTQIEEREEDNNNEQAREEEDEALVALIEHRTKEVQHLRNRLAYYKSQLDEAEKKLEDAQLKLGRARGQNGSTAKSSTLNNGKDIKLENRPSSHEQVGEGSSRTLNQPKENLLQEVAKSSINNERLEGRLAFTSSVKNSSGNTMKDIKLEKCSPSPTQRRESGSASTSGHIKSSPQSQPHSKSQFLSPAGKPTQPIKTEDCRSGASTSISQSNANGMVKQKRDLSRKISPEQEAVESQAKGTKRKLELKEHMDLIPLVCTKSSPSMIRCHTGSVISSQHKRKLRCLELCPTSDQLFATSALDGFVNLWQIQSRGSSANLLSSTDCASAKQRRWPEDIAWHPEGSSLFSVYTADAGDTQISILNLNKTKEGKRVISVAEKPHVKGIINNIVFMPWEDTCFVTGGSDHAVVLWSEKDGENSWKPKVLHRNLHSSAVMGVAGIQNKKIVLSAGADKRIIGFDLASGRAGYKQQVESKCMSIFPNPCDFNMFLVQTGSPERQLSLFDIRLRNTELHAFGWKQESSESQSALINQAWSPDGLYITSGSADPMIHIFDIRYNSRKPSQSIKAHEKRVFKAVWHYSMPLLISISSDLNIELHKVL